MNISGFFFFHSNTANIKQILSVAVLSAVLSCTGTDKEQKASLSQAFDPDPQKIEKQDIKTLEIGEKAPDFNLPEVSGKYISSDDFKNAEVLVVIFTCNHCPTAQAYEERIIKFVNDYKDKSVAVVAINPNSKYSLLLEECSYSDMDDSYENMILRAKDKAYNFPYLYDGDDHAVSVRYGPTATPHAFVFDKNRILTYQGRLDGSEKPGTADAEDLRNAVDATLKGKAVQTPETKVFGCSVKWAWKTEWKEKVDKDWNEMDVTLQKISKEEITRLTGNNSGKLMLINIWATWCGPCVIEYPELINTHRMYYQRDFEFISISADKMEKKDDVLKFLKTKNSAVQNFIYNGSDKYELIGIIDPEWNGSLPYSLLIEPGGKVVFRTSGAVDLQELRRTIVEHPMLGRYY